MSKIKRLQRALRKQGDNPSPSLVAVTRIDPTRTLMLRKMMASQVQRAFDGLNAEVLKRIGDEDWLGLNNRPVDNSMEPDPELAQEQTMIEVAERLMETKDSPDYGQLFFKSETQELWYVSADGDDNSRDMEKQLSTVPMIRKVSIEAEGFPPQGKGWVQVYPRWRDWTRNALTLFPENDLYRPFVTNDSVGHFPSQGLIEVPDIHQPDPHSCGAAAAMSVGRYFGVGPTTIEEWKDALNTDEEESTHPASIVAYLRSLGLNVEAFAGANLSTLDQYLDKGWPVICPIQDYGPTTTGTSHGHYAVVIGRMKNQYIFAQDPSASNVVAGGHDEPLSDTGSVQVPGRVMIAEEDFLTAWHDEDNAGNPFVRFGIAVGSSTTSNTFCPTGKGEGVDDSCSPSTEKGSSGLFAHIKERLGTTVTKFIDKLPYGKTLRSRAVKLDRAIKMRYGEKTAKRIILAANVISWGAFGAGAAAGTMIYVPSSVLMVAGATIAELHLQAKRAVKRMLTKNVEELNETGVQQEARILVTLVRADVIELMGTLNTTSSFPESNGVTNTRWAFQTDHGKILAFTKWFKGQIKKRITSKEQARLWEKYIKDGYVKGTGRAHDDASRAKRAAAPVGRKWYRDKHGRTKYAPVDTTDFYAGTRQQFLKDSFAQPVHVDRLKQLIHRTFTDLEGVTATMADHMRRTLADGLVRGKGTQEVARDLAENVDGIGKKRSLLIARTELVRAHAEGQLDGMETMGVAHVGAAVEWSTSGLNLKDKKGRPKSPCALCKPLQGIVLTISEARGLLPRHPACLCSWIPANVGESPKGQKRSKEDIEDAFEESGIEDAPEISETRPRSIFNERYSQPTWEELNEEELFHNSNPEGFNQYTGKKPKVVKVITWREMQKVGAKTFKLGQVVKVGNEGTPYKMTRVPISSLGFREGDPMDGPSEGREKVKQYATAMRKGVDFPAPQVNIDNGKLSIMDGHHRVAAQRMIRRTHIRIWLEQEGDSSLSENVNSKGCNQYKPCSITGSASSLNTEDLKMRHKTSYDVLFTPAGHVLKMKVKERNDLGKQFREDSDELAKRQNAQSSDKPTIEALLAPVQPRPVVPSAQQGVNQSKVRVAAERMHETVARASVKKGNNNFAHLGDMHDLHPELSREEFVQALQSARRAGKITLSGAEGRHGLSPRDEASAIREVTGTGLDDHTKLLYASMRNTSNVRTSFSENS